MFYPPLCPLLYFSGKPEFFTLFRNQEAFPNRKPHRRGRIFKLRLVVASISVSHVGSSTAQQLVYFNQRNVWQAVSARASERAAETITSGPPLNMFVWKLFFFLNSGSGGALLRHTSGPNRTPRTETVRNEYMYRYTPSVHICVLGVIEN